MESLTGYEFNQLGEQAEQMLEETHPFKEAYMRLRLQLIESWIMATTVEKREENHQLLRALDNIIGELETMMHTAHLQKSEEHDNDRRRQHL